MFSNLKLGILLFPTLLWMTCDSFSIASLFEKCYTYKRPDLSKLETASVVKDVNAFYKNFDQRYQELETFIKNDKTNPKDLDINFFLFTDKNREKPQRLEQNSLNETHFNRKYPVKVIVHGLQPLNITDPGSAAMRHALLVKGQYNVIVMRYQKISRMPYTKALKYSFPAAKHAADFLQNLLKTFKITANRLHLIGFEFGGQLVGNIGNHIPGLARISALDPSGALFERFPDKLRLSPDDATFVDVIHTSTKRFPRGLGIAMPSGHQDFYPNGGRRQPGCKDNITSEMAGGREAAEFKNAICDNQRSIQYYIESICDRFCTFRGRQCDNYKDYETHHCLPFIKATRNMGFYAKKDGSKEKGRKFYLDTNSKYPYCSFFGV